MELTKEMQEITDLLEKAKMTMEKEANKEDLTIEDLERLITMAQDVLNQLNEKSNEIIEKSGFSKEELEKMAADSKNFSSEDLAIITQVREQSENLRKSLEKTIFAQQNDLIIKQEQDEKKQHKLKKTRKNWMPM